MLFYCAIFHFSKYFEISVHRVLHSTHSMQSNYRCPWILTKPLWRCNSWRSPATLSDEWHTCKYHVKCMLTGAAPTWHILWNIFEKKFVHLCFLNKIEKVEVKRVKKNCFSHFFPEMFFFKLKKKIRSDAIPHPARQCACASRCCARIYPACL